MGGAVVQGYLDEQGNDLTAPPPSTDGESAAVYLDDQGNPIKAKAPTTSAAPSWIDAVMSNGPAAMTGAAYAAEHVLPKALPVINRAATMVASNPNAAKGVGALITMGLGATRGLSSGVDLALEAAAGTTVGGLVQEGAKKLAQVTAGARATIGRAANGRFMRIPATKLPSVLAKAGQAMGMISGEGAALEQMNTPEAIQRIKDTFRMPTR